MKPLPHFHDTLKGQTERNRRAAAYLANHSARRMKLQRAILCVLAPIAAAVFLYALWFLITQ